MTKEWKCIGLKVIGRTAVIAEMKLSIMEEGKPIAWKVDSDFYHRTSDWSQADPLVQGVCQVVFADESQREPDPVGH